jgi:hypothetical protein
VGSAVFTTAMSSIRIAVAASTAASVHRWTTLVGEESDPGMQLTIEHARCPCLAVTLPTMVLLTDVL